MDSMGYTTQETFTGSNMPAKVYWRTCPECGERHAALGAKGRFCSTTHKNDFNNRRAMRGMILYDLFMANRYQRGIAKQMKLLTFIYKVMRAFRDEDQRERDGRVSWVHPKKVVQRYSYLGVEVCVSHRDFVRPRPVSEELPEVDV